MGHARHFLERLERTNHKHTERAMELYYQPKLVDWMLDKLALSTDIQRLALSLDEEDDGPFLVLTREGHFVTCLGKGMSTGDLYTVHFERYQYLHQYASKIVKELGLLHNKENTQHENAFQAFYTDGLMLGRESFERMAALFRVLRFGMYERCVETILEQNEFYEGMANTKRSKGSRLYMKVAGGFWRANQSISHMAVYCSLEGRAGFSDIFRELAKNSKTQLPYEENSLYLPYKYLGISGEFSMMARAIWGIGRLGKPAWPMLKEILRNEKIYELEWRVAFLGSIVLANRCKPIRKQIDKTLLNPKTMMSEQFLEFVMDIDDDRQEYENFIKKMFICLQEPEKLIGEYESVIRKIAFDAIQQKGVLPQFKEPEDLTRQEAFALITNSPGNVLVDKSKRMYWQVLMSLLPWLCVCEAADFYLPEYIAKNFRMSPKEQSELGVALFQAQFNKSGKKKKPVRAKQKKIGSNERCPCGSGKKYKKCCMRKANPPKERATPQDDSKEKA